MALFNREVKVTIGEPGKQGIVVTDLRVVFQSRASTTKTPNKSTVRIYNLSVAHCNAIAVGHICQVIAGYTGSVMPIITGEVTRVENYLDKVDRVTELEVHDSMAALRDSKTSISFPPNTSASAILKAVGANFGLPIRQNITGEDRQIVTGFAVNTRTRNAMTEICDYLGLEWSAQQGEIQVMNKGTAYAKQAVILSPSSGLIGSPKPKSYDVHDKKAGKAGIKYGQDGVRRYTKTDPTAKIKDRQMYEVQGYEIKALLTGAIYPGSFVKLISRGIDGLFFVCDECTYQGDTHGGDWTVDATINYPKEIKQNGN